MTKKKNGFWTFWFSFIPGAGEMYMGFMKQGISLMGLFCLVIFLAYTLDMPAILFVGVIIWFYGFFHVHNIRSMDDEAFYGLEDQYLFHISELEPYTRDLGGKYKKVIGIGLIFWGAAVLWRNVWYIIREWMPDALRMFVSDFNYRLPQIVLAVVIIWIGLLMIRGKKQELYGQKDDARDTADTFAASDVTGINQEEH